MNDTKDGGPVFPDMSLRDYFAGQALAGYLANQCVGNPDESIAWSDEPSIVSELCYDYADAMLAERERDSHDVR